MSLGAGKRRRLLAERVSREAAFAYTSGSQRQALDLAAWLLAEWRSEAELAERLAYALAEMTPENAAALRTAEARVRKDRGRRAREERRRRRGGP